MSNRPVQILLVEDNPHDVELTLHAFASHQLTNRIHVARDGAEALDFIFAADGLLATDAAPTIILLDLKLPRVDGLDVLQRLKSDPRTMSIPVVVLTSSQDDRDVIQSYQLGVNSYIVKPVDFEQFTQAVRTLGLYWRLLDEAPAAQADDLPIPSERA